jgi:hypothetical protein
MRAMLISLFVPNLFFHENKSESSSMCAQNIQRHDRQRFFVGRRQRNRWRDPIIKRVFPPRQANTPLIASLQASKPIRGTGRDEVIAAA